MRSQTALRVSEWTLFAAIVFTHLVARWFLLRLEPDNEYVGPAILEGLLIAQVGMLVAWGILGPGAALIRLPVALCLLWLIWIVDNSRISLCYWVLKSEMALLAVAFVGLRVWGARIVHHASAVSPWNDYFRPRWSIKALIVATAAGAILVKTGMVARSYWLADPTSHAPISGMLLAVLTSATMLLCLWTMLLPTDAFYRLMFVAPICGLLAFLVLAPLHSAYGELFLPVASLLGYEAAVLVSTLLLVRLAGFRLVRPVSDAQPFKASPTAIAKESSAPESFHALQVSI